jgi:phosphoglycerol transferase MdoB-like AlkP superfamily enzyme
MPSEVARPNRQIAIRVVRVAVYFLFWVLWSQAARVAFLAYQWPQTSHVGLVEVVRILVHGIKLDASVAAVISLVPMCVLARAGSIAPRECRRILTVYTAIVATVAAIVVVADLEIFRMWGFHLDIATLGYLAHPREVIASAKASPVLELLFLLFAILATSLVCFRMLIRRLTDGLQTIGIRDSAAVLFFCAPLIIAERGGVNWRVPVSATSGYFSTHMYSNKATSNPLWSLAYSAIAPRSDRVERYSDPATASAIVDSLVKRSGQGRGARIAPRLLRYRPRFVIVVLWESLNWKMVSQERVASVPGLEAFAKQGILFSHIYAAGTRTTNGLVATLSGFPTHPVANPLASSRRSARLPSLAGSMAHAGYRTAFYYGGSLSFDNRGRYLRTSGYDHIVEKRNFDRAVPRSPWGVHDPFVLERLVDELDTASVPVFATTLTLSSHEPYTVPGLQIVKGHDAQHQFLNAQAYTDRAVSEFLLRLHRTTRWDSTLVVVIGDHGNMFPLDTSSFWGAPSMFRMPMIWLGGAVARDTVIDDVGSQVDIPALLLDQLGLNRSDFRWSKDVLVPEAPAFAFYAFQDAFGFVDRHGAFVFDNLARSLVYQSGHVVPASVAAGRAFQQNVMEMYRAMAIPAQVATRGHR